MVLLVSAKFVFGNYVSVNVNQVFVPKMGDKVLRGFFSGEGRKVRLTAMVRFLIRATAAALGFWIASKVLHGVRVSSVESLLFAGLLLGVVNAMVRPVLVILTLPLTILTLGLFLLVVNAITVWIVTRFVHGVQIHGSLHYILTALIISITSWVVGGVLHPDTRRW